MQKNKNNFNKKQNKILDNKILGVYLSPSAS
jgi:hypothetical protein